MSEEQKIAIRRSIHFVPGGVEKMFAKALGLPADSLILDLEDSVTPDKKQSARDAVCEWLTAADFAGHEKLVRVNPLDSQWGRADIEAIVAAKPHSIVVPKVLGAASVSAVSELIKSLELRHGLPEGDIKLLLIGTEDAAAVFNLQTMAGHPRVNGLTWGAEDLSVSLGAKTKRDGRGEYLDVFKLVRSMCLLAAVAAKVQPIDAVYVDVKNSKGLEAECKTAADMGYTGKLTIHPEQIEIVNAAFTPSQHEIDEATALLAEFAQQQNEGRMAFTFNGQMVDVPHLKRAQQILAIAAHLAGQTS
ncbi:MAG: citrate lyase subunit beta/citryl-CoA lyase [Pseudohongiellaceae bacterium]|jgi:citrate lyase subunit beta/citryl-CoA lyase